MPAIFYQLPKDEPSPPELMPTRQEARGVRADLRRGYQWKRELGSTGYAVACSGAFHALIIGAILWSALGWKPAPIEPMETLDSSLIKVKFVFKEKTQPVEKQVAAVAKKLPAVKPLVEKEAPKSVAKKTPRPKSKPKKVRVAKKATPPKARKLAAGVADNGSEPRRDDPPKVVEAGPDLQLDTDPELPKPVEEAPVETVVAQSPLQPDVQVDLKAIYANYRTKVHGSFKRHSRYPRRAERAGLEGKVVVEVVIDAQGVVVQRRILKSSGHKILDNAALKSAMKITRLPAPPSELNWSKKTLEVPFVYRAQTNADSGSGRST